MFRDSCWDPDGGEVVVHEYQILGHGRPRARASALGHGRATRAALRRVPRAAPNASWMAGTELRAMRREVLARLRNADCCTHLNDGLRSLAEVPILAASLSA